MPLRKKKFIFVKVNGCFVPQSDNGAYILLMYYFILDTIIKNILIIQYVAVP